MHSDPSFTASDDKPSLRRGEWIRFCSPRFKPSETGSTTGQASGENRMSNPLSEQEAAPRIGLKVSSLQKMRHFGNGPRFLKLGRTVRYREQDLEEWLAARVVSSTAERGSA